MMITPIKPATDNGGIVPPWLLPGVPDPDTPRILPMPPAQKKEEKR